MKRLACLATLVCLAVAAAGCGGDDEDAATSADIAIPEDTQLVDAAKKDGTLTWYSAFPPEAIDKTVEAFEERHPDIEVKSLRLTSGQLGTRYAEERSSNAKTADIVSLSDITFFETAAKKRWFENQLDLAALDEWPKDYYTDGRPVVGLLPLWVARNTDKVERSDAPDQWAEVTDPKWKGQVIYGDPRSVPAYLGLAELWRREYGEEYLEKFAALEPKLVESVVPGGQQLAAGSGSLIVPGSNTTLNPLIDEGAPIEITEVAPTTGIEFAAAVSTDTPHPDAAKLFMNFLMTKPGQAAVNSGGGSSVLGKVSDDTVPLPKGYQRVDPLVEDARKREEEILSLLGIEG